MKMSNRTLVKTTMDFYRLKIMAQESQLKAIYAINRNIEMLVKAAIPFQESEMNC